MLLWTLEYNLDHGGIHESIETKKYYMINQSINDSLRSTLLHCMYTKWTVAYLFTH